MLKLINLRLIESVNVGGLCSQGLNERFTSNLANLTEFIKK